MTSLKDFPTADEVRAKISHLTGTAWPEFKLTDDIKEYTDRVSKMFTGEFGILPDIVQFKKANELSFRIFRARELSSFGNIDLICEHSYSPIHLTAKLNRCNFPKHPVFYCSNNAMTALCEVVRNDKFEKKKYCLSRWNIAATNDHVIVQPYLFGDLHADNIFKIWQEALNRNIRDAFENNFTADQEEGMRLYLKFMADIFINDNNYSMSAFFAHRRLYAPHNYATEILIYPSVQTLSKGVNIAIHPNFVDRMMSLIRFYIVEVNDLDTDSGKINISFSAYGVFERSSIRWTQVKPDDKVYREYIKEDFDHGGEFEFIERTP